MKYLFYKPVFFCIFLVFSSAALMATETNVGKWRLEIDEANGKADIYYQNKLLIAKTQCSFKNGTETISQEQLNNRSVLETSLTDEFGNGKLVRITSKGNNGLTVTHRYYLYENKDYLLTDFTIETTQQTLSSNYMAPIKTATASNFLPQDNNNRSLYVPFDNDKWIRYKVNNFGTATTSFEAGLLYNTTTREGLVMGSIEHTTWKTGVKTNTSSTNTVNGIEIYGGITARHETSDMLPHGAIKGNKLKSPRIFIGYYADWREGMEAYGDANALVAPKLPWDKGKPFGWNSWGAIQTNLSYTNATETAIFIKDELQDNHFSNDETVYIGLDSYWDNLTLQNRMKFVRECKARGQKAGIYWTPFVDWAKNPDRAVEGSSGVYYRDIYLYANGNPQEIAGAYAIDPTHPATKKRMDTYLNQFKTSGFEFLKLDFLTHGTLEADSYYDENVHTGIQAYNQGMQYIVDVMDNSMYLNLSIAPLFPANYGHGRRIACDAYSAMTGFGSTEYTLNSLTYGWWLDRVYTYNDADNVVLSGVGVGENRARITSSVITGIFIIGDDYSASGPSAAKVRAREYLTNEEINRIARQCTSFRPVESGNGDAAADMYINTLADTTYVAVFNYETQNTPVELKFDRLGLVSGKDYTVHELWADKIAEKNASFSETIPRRDVRVYKIYPKKTSNGVAQIETNRNITVFPNPCKDKLTIQLPGEEQPEQVNIYSLQGTRVKSEKQVSTETSVAGLLAGIYIISITSNNGKCHNTVVVKE